MTKPSFNVCLLDDLRKPQERLGRFIQHTRIYTEQSTVNFIGVAKPEVNYCGNVSEMPGSALLKPNEYSSELVSILELISFWSYDLVSSKDK